MELVHPTLLCVVQTDCPGRVGRLCAHACPPSHQTLQQAARAPDTSPSAVQHFGAGVGHAHLTSFPPGEALAPSSRTPRSLRANAAT